MYSFIKWCVTSALVCQLKGQTGCIRNTVEPNNQTVTNVEKHLVRLSLSQSTKFDQSRLCLPSDSFLHRNRAACPFHQSQGMSHSERPRASHNQRMKPHAGNLEAPICIMCICSTFYPICELLFLL